MIKKDTIFKWVWEEKEYFYRIKETILEAPSFSSPDFNKDFSLYTFASNSSLLMVLTQKDCDHDEHPISFMSTRLQGAKLNHPDINNQAYVVYKSLKHFKPYILKNHVTVLVPHPTAISLFVQ